MFDLRVLRVSVPARLLVSGIGYDWHRKRAAGSATLSASVQSVLHVVLNMTTN